LAQILVNFFWFFIDQPLTFSASFRILQIFSRLSRMSGGNNYIAIDTRVLASDGLVPCVSLETFCRQRQQTREQAKATLVIQKWWRNMLEISRVRNSFKNSLHHSIELSSCDRLKYLNCCSH
jgi:hypothetical protein